MFKVSLGPRDTTGLNNFNLGKAKLARFYHKYQYKISTESAKEILKFLRKKDFLKNVYSLYLENEALKDLCLYKLFVLKSLKESHLKV